MKFFKVILPHYASSKAAYTVIREHILPPLKIWYIPDVVEAFPVLIDSFGSLVSRGLGEEGHKHLFRKDLNENMCLYSAIVSAVLLMYGTCGAA